jgi:hypothetical protein
MAESMIVLVTGANRGIGFAIVQVLARRIPTATILLGCRSSAAGQEAIEKLRELGVKSKLDVVELDIGSDSSIVAAVARIEKEYGRLDGKKYSPVAAAQSDRKDDLMANDPSSHSADKQRCDRLPASIARALCPPGDIEQDLQQRCHINRACHAGFHSPSSQEQLAAGDHDFQHQRESRQDGGEGGMRSLRTAHVSTSVAGHQVA